MDNRLFNLIRYFLSFVMLVMSCIQPYLFVSTAIVLLVLNNWLDDVVFYLGNKTLKNVSCRYGFISPVNGIVTVVEEGVELFSGIKKINPLTHKELMSLHIVNKDDKRERYSHVAIFLNKLNHHVVVNPERCIDTECHYGSKKEMVGAGQLVGANGVYLCNDAVILRYPSCFIVVTLDKYVGEYIQGWYEEMSPQMIICKGSQCDIFFRNCRKPIKKVGDLVNIGDDIAEPFFNESPLTRSIDEEKIDNLVHKALLRHGGLLQMLCDNIHKSIDTFKNPVIAVSCVVGAVAYFLSPIISYVAFSSVILFVCIRWYRHLMYCVMNYVGLKPWMDKSYKALSKLSVIWQRKKS